MQYPIIFPLRNLMENNFIESMKGKAPELKNVFFVIHHIGLDINSLSWRCYSWTFPLFGNVEGKTRYQKTTIFWKELTANKWVIFIFPLAWSFPKIMSYRVAGGMYHIVVPVFTFWAFKTRERRKVRKGPLHLEASLTRRE